MQDHKQQKKHGHMQDHKQQKKHSHVQDHKQQKSIVMCKIINSKKKYNNRYNQ